MAIVARGLGQPEGGAVVADGFGAATDTGVRWASATIAGTSTLTATATVTQTTPPRRSSGGVRREYVQPRPVPAWASATLAGSSTLTATATAVMNFDAELEQLLLVGVL